MVLGGAWNRLVWLEEDREPATSRRLAAVEYHLRRPPSVVVRRITERAVDVVRTLNLQTDMCFVDISPTCQVADSEVSLPTTVVNSPNE